MNTLNRSPAAKIWIKDINDAEFIDGEQSGIQLGDQIISRVNLMGVVINKTQEGQQGDIQTIDIEDATGKIQARTFDAVKKSNADVGDCVFLIGRVRKYNNQKYIATEIIKKINQPEWIEVRKKETPLQLQEQKIQPLQEEKKPIEKETELQKIILLIKQKDTGAGVDYDELQKEINSPNAEDMLQLLVQTGEIFHITPTRIKVLE